MHTILGFRDREGNIGYFNLRPNSSSLGDFNRGALAMLNANKAETFTLEMDVSEFKHIFNIQVPPNGIITRSGFTGIQSTFDLNTLIPGQYVELLGAGAVRKGTSYTKFSFHRSGKHMQRLALDSRD